MLVLRFLVGLYVKLLRCAFMHVSSTRKFAIEWGLLQEMVLVKSETISVCASYIHKRALTHPIVYLQVATRQLMLT